MVEGGARVIQSFLKETQPGLDGKAVPIVDNIIITIAPTLVGADGVGYECDLTTQVSFTSVLFVAECGIFMGVVDGTARAHKNGDIWS